MQNKEKRILTSGDLEKSQPQKFEIMTHLLHMDHHQTKIEINLTSINP